MIFLRAVPVTKEEAAACEIVFLAVPWDHVPEKLASLPKWKNQILIDGTHPLHAKGRNFTERLTLSSDWTRRRQNAMKYQHPELDIVCSALNDTQPDMPPAIAYSGYGYGTPEK
jgi:predicted dinucleotide-binding enzyme